MKIEDLFLAAIYKSTSGPLFSSIIRKLSQYRPPEPVLRIMISSYIRFFDIDMKDVAPQKWHSMQEFFIRRLKEGARPVDMDPEVIVSPADGILLSVGKVKDGMVYQVKGLKYHIEQLLVDYEYSELFKKGNYFTVYLTPSDYHRVHAPVDCEVLRIRWVPGLRYSVNPKVTRYVDSRLYKNERFVIDCNTKLFGRLSLIMVAAAGVGNMRVHAWERDDLKPYMWQPPIGQRVFKKGEELGWFNLGSTVVVFIQEEDLKPLAMEDSIRVYYGMGILKKEVKDA